MILHRMIGAVMALMHLGRGRAKRQPQHLMAKTDAEHGQAAVDQLADFRNGVFARRSRIARPVRQEHAIGFAFQHVFRRGRCRQHGDPAAR